MAVIAAVIVFVLGAPWWLAIVSGVLIEVVVIALGSRTGVGSTMPDPRAGHRPTLHDWTARGPWGEVPR